MYVCIADKVSQAVKVQWKCSLHCDKSLFARKRWHLSGGGEGISEALHGWKLRMRYAHQSGDVLLALTALQQVQQGA